MNSVSGANIATGEKRSIRLYFIDFDNTSVNALELLEGEKITEDYKNSVYAEVSDNVIKGYSVGEEVEINLAAALNLPFAYKIKVTVKGIVRSPLTFGKDGEPSYNNPEDTEIPDNVADISKLDLLENILYCPTEVCPFMPKGDLYITAKNRNLFSSFSFEYESYVEQEKLALTGLLGGDVRILTLYDNYSFKFIISSADKVRGIGNILMINFIAVALLVVLSSMMRLMDEERSQIACLKTLGYGFVGVVMRYILFTLVSVAVSAGLVYAGLALLDVCLFGGFGSPAIIDIAAVVLAYAGLLTAVVINTLTTINISERERKIATLMVLDYHDYEICGYIYREIYISTFLGILLGYPVGVGLATLVFKTIGFGTVANVSWFMWLFVPLIVFGFTLLVTLMLRPKIVKTKMNESLKAVE